MFHALHKVDMRLCYAKQKINLACSKVKQKSLTITKGNCMLCLSNNGTLCCTQIIKTTTFQSNKNKKTYNIYHNMNCKSKYAKYLMECTKCKLQYVHKGETGHKVEH